MSELALLGGNPIITETFKPYKSIGDKEKSAVMEVMDSGLISGFYGSWNDKFWGGPKIQEFEAAWKKQFKVKHAISVNSNTSGLYAAMAAIGISPGDEVIISPYTMSATAMAPLGYGAIPVFADIEPETFGLDPQAVRDAISPRTKAILVTNIFGHSARLTELKAIADEHDLYLIEDNAQAPLGTENGVYCGTIGHIGIFSLNYHKHIHTGEGGMCTTNDDDLAQRLAMVRNHAEAVVDAAGVDNLVNMFGHNFRMTELSAAIGLVQLEDIEHHVRRREALSQSLSVAVAGADGIIAPHVRENCRHVYYVWAAQIDQDTLGISRSTFSKALSAEGVPNFEGYLAPLYMLPIFQKRIAMGRDGFPFNQSDVTYEAGMCPVVEDMKHNRFLGFEPCAYDLSEGEIKLIQDAFGKVLENIDDLKKYEYQEAS
ncbi:MAG: pyridoxal-5'-phosphate-dependent protein [Zetaproteobacteria bacterium]|nr:MAG: pyridoxal-5'-phosphate-dependent protein [Zetaproteobacteria bacterium]